MTDFIEKGIRVATRGLYAQRIGSYSLAGAQLKLAGREIAISGTIAHVRGNHPLAPTKVWVWLVPDDPNFNPDFSDLEPGPDSICFERCPKCGRSEVGPIPVGFVLGPIHQDE